ncbi:CLUMA_CG004758, isoform A [Clunio marinus]|uniref:CLUMA_CG004758, isoform A n=1 Tax=Clunio marinus TaxID=568069 RepID=A0A1J1HX19_9DIPT|nr:CLUMA_CG004758, isoform A [Clunio marinus]
MDVWLGTIQKDTQCGKFRKLKSNSSLKDNVQSETKSLVTKLPCYIQDEQGPIGLVNVGNLVGYIILEENSVMNDIKNNNYACNVNLLQMEGESIEKWKCSKFQTEKQMIKEDVKWQKSCTLCDEPISRHQAANSYWVNEQVDENGKPVYLIRAAHMRCVALKWRVPAMREETCLNCGWWQEQGLHGNQLCSS